MEAVGLKVALVLKIISSISLWTGPTHLPQPPVPAPRLSVPSTHCFTAISHLLACVKEQGSLDDLKGTCR